MAEAEWYKNPYAWLGAAAGAAIAIPVAVAVAPPVMAGLGVIGGAAALTALGAGVIAITSVIGKHIDEAIEANNSHETIKKILDSTETDYTDAKKIEDIKRIAKAKTDNKFLKSFNIGGNSSEEIGYIYLGALNSQEVYDENKAKKIIDGLKVVNKLDQLRLKEPESTDDSKFIMKLDKFKTIYTLYANYNVGQEITKHSDKFFDGVALKEDTNNVQNFFDLLGTAIGAARPAGPAPAGPSGPGDDAAAAAAAVVAAAASAPAPPAARTAARPVLSGAPARHSPHIPDPAAGLGGGGAAAAAPATADGGGDTVLAAAATRAADIKAREDKIRGDFIALEKDHLLSIIYQYKVSMGLDILSDNSKNNDQKIDLLKNLMSIQSAGDTGYKRIDNLISDFTEIDAKAPEGAIATDTPWPKALRIFAQKILSDVSADITDQNRILALEAYLNKLKSGDSDVSSIQTKIQSGSILTCNSTQKSAEDFLKRISNVPAGEDGKKDISSIKAFDDAAAASIDIASAADAAAAVAAAAAAEAKKAKIRADFSTEDTAETFYQTLYKYRLGVARDILKSLDDNEKIGKLKTLFLYNVKPTTLEDRRDDFVNWFADSDFLAPDITDIKTPLSAGNLRTFANAILDDKDVAPDVKIRALNSHIQELLGLTAESANNDAFNFYKTEAIPANSSSVLSNLKAIATKFLNDFKSGSTPTFESAYNTVFIPAPAPAAAAAAAPTATPALARRAAPAADTAAHAP